jgi:hypothetical protein
MLAAKAFGANTQHKSDARFRADANLFLGTGLLVIETSLLKSGRGDGCRVK